MKLRYHAILALLAIVAAVTGLIIDANAERLTPLQQVLEGYNHVTVYEDGSYVAQTRTGFSERGCISTGICND